MKLKVYNLESPRTGKAVANQFHIITDNGEYFQSYDSIIVFIPKLGKIQLGKNWNYSNTTNKYRISFLGESTKETQKKLDDGTYVLNYDL